MSCSFYVCVNKGTSAKLLGSNFVDKKNIGKCQFTEIISSSNYSQTPTNKFSSNPKCSDISKLGATCAFTWPSLLRLFLKYLPSLSLRRRVATASRAGCVRRGMGSGYVHFKASLLARMTEDPVFCSWPQRGSPQASSAALMS